MIVDNKAWRGKRIIANSRGKGEPFIPFVGTSLIDVIMFGDRYDLDKRQIALFSLVGTAFLPLSMGPALGPGVGISG